MIDFITFSVTLPYPTFAAFLAWMMMSFAALIGLFIYGLINGHESYHRKTYSFTYIALLTATGLVLWPYLMYTATKKGYF